MSARAEQQRRRQRQQQQWMAAQWLRQGQRHASKFAGAIVAAGGLLMHRQAAGRQGSFWDLDYLCLVRPMRQGFDAKRVQRARLSKLCRQGWLAGWRRPTFPSPVLSLSSSDLSFLVPSSLPRPCFSLTSSSFLWNSKASDLAASILLSIRAKSPSREEMASRSSLPAQHSAAQQVRAHHVRACGRAIAWCLDRSCSTMPQPGQCGALRTAPPAERQTLVMAEEQQGCRASRLCLRLTIGRCIARPCSPSLTELQSLQHCPQLPARKRTQIRDNKEQTQP